MVLTLLRGGLDDEVLEAWKVTPGETVDAETAPGDVWRWTCDLCGWENQMTFASEVDARRARLAHEAGCGR